MRIAAEMEVEMEIQSELRKLNFRSTPHPRPIIERAQVSRYARNFIRSYLNKLR